MEEAMNTIEVLKDLIISCENHLRGLPSSAETGDYDIERKRFEMRIQALTAAIEALKAVEEAKAELPKKWDCGNDYSPEDYAYGDGYNAYHSQAVPIVAKIKVGYDWYKEACESQVEEIAKLKLRIKELEDGTTKI